MKAIHRLDVLIRMKTHGILMNDNCWKAELWIHQSLINFEDLINIHLR